MIASDPEIVKSIDEWGFTALHGVAGEEHYDIAAYLIDNGADVNAKNDEGIAPLHLAASWSVGKCLGRGPVHCPQTNRRITSGIGIGLGVNPVTIAVAAQGRNCRLVAAANQERIANARETLDSR